MKKLSIYLLFLCTLLISTKCSEEQQPVKQHFTPQSVDLKFDVSEGQTKIVRTKMIYNESLQRYQLISNHIYERTALHEKTNEVIYIYSLKSELTNGRSLGDPNTIKTGYYGYSQDDGCWHWGTLVTDSKGVEHFFPGNDGLNAPICPGGIWTLYEPNNDDTDLPTHPKLPKGLL